MDATLVVCWKCRRHVLATERKCPFCAASRTGWLVVAAALSAGVALAACATSGTASTTPQPPPAPPLGTTAPSTTSDPVPVASDSSPAQPPAPAPDPPPAPAPGPSPFAGLGQVGLAGAHGPPPGTQPGLSGAYGPPPGATPASAGWAEIANVGVEAPLAVQDVLRGVRQNLNRMRNGCYRAGLVENPGKTSWKAKVSFRIGENGGQVLDATVEGSDLPGSSARACLAAVTRSMAFPALPPGSQSASVEYDVMFAPALQKPPPPRP